MKIILAIVLGLSIAACSIEKQRPYGESVPVVESHVKAAVMPMAAPSQAGVRSGAAEAAELTSRYHDTRENCGKDSMPAFLCTGIDLRGTQASTQYDSWNPSPTAVKVGGVSFSYLRSDYKMMRLAYNYTNGFILYPVLGKV
ncbi:hypothetical protein [Pseudomonas sp. MH10]|uniref:hypothetical protein n=1 Tax=Pseudomonas sp. MH10 TaxID=3048627 RepID=UPI002AC929E6|nr:hypothetical protein [Pseudomonas sp. MH10]MEB0041095.1 hypothetical protein [Pseudomonas sp. MH10]WPX63204.1 hypothetical protein RHM59_20220 [Pseudomonas sp. MH10]